MDVVWVFHSSLHWSTCVWRLALALNKEVYFVEFLAWLLGFLAVAQALKNHPNARDKQQFLLRYMHQGQAGPLASPQWLNWYPTCRIAPSFLVFYSWTHFHPDRQLLLAYLERSQKTRNPKFVWAMMRAAHVYVAFETTNVAHIYPYSAAKKLPASHSGPTFANPLQ